MAALVRVNRIAYGILRLECLLLLADELDRLRGLGGVELGALGRDDHQIGPADGVGDHHGGGALEIHDDEGRLVGGAPRSRR